MIIHIYTKDAINNDMYIVYNYLARWTTIYDLEHDFNELLADNGWNFVYDQDKIYYMSVNCNSFQEFKAKLSFLFV